MTNIPYTYLIKCIPTNQYYYGVRYSKGCTPDDLWKTYFTSSLYIKELVTAYGKAAFEVQIRRVFTNNDDARRWEAKVLRRMRVVSRTDFINKSDNVLLNTKNRVWMTDGIVSRFVDAAIVDDFTLRGWKPGRKFSANHAANLKRSKEGGNIGTANPMYGRAQSESMKSSLRANRSGRICGPLKITHDVAKHIINKFEERPTIDQRWGDTRSRSMTYENAFCRYMAALLGVTPLAIRNTIRGKTLIAKGLIKQK
jgi:hypothetical protein